MNPSEAERLTPPTPSHHCQVCGERDGATARVAELERRLAELTTVPLAAVVQAVCDAKQ